MIGLTLGTGVGGVIAIDGRIDQGHDGRPARSATRRSTRTGRGAAAVLGCVEAYARADQLARRARRRPRRRRSPGRGTATRGARGLARGRPLPRDRDREPRHARHAGPGRHRRRRGGGGRPPVRADPAELGRRVKMTSLDEVTVVAAELGRGRARSGRRSTARSRRRRPDRGRPRDDDPVHPAAGARSSARCGERIATLTPRRPPAVRRGAVRRVLRVPDDGP